MQRGFLWATKRHLITLSQESNEMYPAGILILKDKDVLSGLRQFLAPGKFFKNN